VVEEIGEMTIAQQGEILALVAAAEGAGGGMEAARAPRIVATTSQDLSAAARKGVFREELLSLLMDEALYLPPLRERPEDVTAMAEQMLTHFAGLYRRRVLTLEPEAKQALVGYPWPGNVHELRNTIEHVVLAASRAEVGESELRLPAVTDSGCGPSGHYLSLDAMEKQHILRVIRATATLEEAARILHVDITTLWRKRRRYGV
jgi:NtrC-family two-component system response regulator AlgB